MASESKKTGPKYKEAERESTNVPSTPASAVPGPSEKDSKKIVINDKTQYKDYFLRKNLGWKVSYERKSFPISCRSEEAKAFEKTVTRLEEDLSKHKIRWTSIDCIGRSNYGTADPIKSTILISVPPGHSPKYKSCWNCEWNNKKISLAIEILNGGIEQESFGNTSNKINPLACGSSCGSLSHQKRTGTIGGFINLANGLDNHQDKPIYAMSCHHVFAPDQPRVKWGDEKIRPLYDMVYKKLDGQYHPSHEPQDMITRLINWIKVAFDFQETECLLYFKILVLTVDNFQPRSAMISFVAHSFLKWFCQKIRQLGSKYNLEVDVEGLNQVQQQIDSFLRGFQPRVNMLSRSLFAIAGLPQNPASPENTRDILELLSGICHAMHAGVLLTSKQAHDLIPRELLNLFGLDTKRSSEGQSSDLKDFSKYFEGSLALWVNTWNNRDEICKALSCFIDHPSKMDRVAARQALELKLVEHKKWAGTSSLPVSRELPHISMDTKASNRFISATEKELKEMCAIDNNPALATIGTISVSSGIDAKDDPFNPDAKKEREDWALAKMLPSIECQNFLDKNVLAPNRLQGKGQEVLGVRSWKDNEEWDRLNVFKRGRTTDYTVGTVQGMRRHLEGEGIQSVATHVIVSEEQERPFSKRGDSGSWVIDSHGLLVGMIWGKSDFDDTTYFTPADYIFRYIPERILEDGGPTAQVCKIPKKKLNLPAESIFEIAPRSRAGTPSKFIDLLATTKAITNTS